MQDLFVSCNLSILEVMKVMDQKRIKLLVVITDESNYVSLVSIGDIQRAILKALPLTTPVNQILRNDYIVAFENDDFERIKEIMLSIRAPFMPILDENKRIVKLIFWEDLFGKNEQIPVDLFDLPVVIMAGGMGTRLKPLTNVLPKPLIPIGDKTMLEEIFDRFSKYGCSNFLISVNYKADLIEYYIKSLKLDLKIDFFIEDKPLGTAGSLHLLKGKITSTFFVSNCDILIEDDYSKILDYHIKNRNEITIVSALKSFSIPYGTLKTGNNGDLLSIEEKPDLNFSINTGMYVLEPNLLDEIPENKFFHITNLIEKILNRKGKIGVFPVSEKSWKDIGDWNEFVKNMNP